MATRRVTALATRDEDLDVIREIAREPQIAGRVVVCDVEEGEIRRLEDRGILVQEIEEKELPEAGAVAPPPTPMMAGLPEDFAAPSPDAVRTLGAEEGPAAVDIYILSVSGPMLPAWRQALEDAGAELLERLEGGDFSARIPIERIPGVRELAFVSDLRRFTALDTVDTRQLASSLAPPQAGAEEVAYEAYLHPGADPQAVERWLQERSVDIAGSSRRKIRFYALRGAGVISELAKLPDVGAIEEFVPPRLANDHALRLIGLDRQAGGGERTGLGQVVAVADTGLDEQHPDFTGRIRQVFARGRPNDPSDTHGHGTHVAGSVLGDGSASGGGIKGSAPEAELVFQSVMDARGGLGGLGVDLADLFDQAYAEGARIHNNSWGALARSAYRINSLEVDAYVHGHPDILIVIAAGNSGTASRPVVSAKGFVDLLSVDSPGTAKNALTVGASRSDRQISGTFGAWWPKDFPDPPISDAPLSGDPEALAAFSGRGPCDEQIRIKPDVVAPGTFILSARSSIAPTRSFWAENPDNRAYAFMGGTSMAAPIVSGCAAVVRQYFVDERQHSPSAALLKATLINGTRWLGGADAVADHSTEPNYHQGFGCVHMPSTIPGPGGGLRLEFRDTQGNDAESLAETGAWQDYVLNTGEGEIRVCLAWTDPPGRGLQNTVTLIMEHAGTGERWLGNPHRPPGVMVWDAGNNVQVIRLPDAKAGAYRISVVASNLLVQPQAFALAAAGPLESELAPV